MELLEYLVRVRGAAVAAAEMRGLAGDMNKLAASQARVGATGAEAAAGTGRLGGAAAAATKGVAALGIAAVGIGLEAVKMSTSFNHEMLRIRTDAGASSKELADMKKGVLDLAASGQSMGQGPMSLAQGLYHLESLGIRGSRALQALKLASQETAISGASLEETTTAMGAAMYVGIKGTGDLTKLMGTLNATVGAGNMRFQDLVEALGTGVLPAAKVAGLSIQDVSAALAVATDSGYKASSAAAQLGTAFHFLYAPTDKAKSALESIHLGANQLGMDMHKPQGLLVALRDLRDHLQGLSQVQQAQVLNAILPGGRGRILLTELTMLDRLQGKYKQINATAGGFTGAVAAQTHDPQTQLRTSEASLQANMIRLGNVLTPIVVPALAALARAASSVIGWLAKMIPQIGKLGSVFSGAGHTFDSVGRTVSHAFDSISKTATGLWKTLSKAFSEILGGAHKTFSVGFVKDLATIGAKILQFGAILFGVFGKIVGFYLPYIANAFKATFTVIKGVIEFFAGLLTLDFSKMWDGIKTIFSGAVAGVLNILHQGVALLGAGAMLIVNAIVGVFSGLGNLIWGVIKGAINLGIIGPLNSLIDILDSIHVSIPDWVPGVGGSSIGFNIGHIPQLAGGGTLTRGGAVMVGERGREILNLPAGASVTPLEKASGWGGGDIVLQVDGRELARATRRQIRAAQASGA